MSGNWLATGWTGVVPLAGTVLQCAQTGSEVHPASYAIGTGSAFTVSKAAEVKVTLVFVCCRSYK
jgi:hypothetical protein